MRYIVLIALVCTSSAVAMNEYEMLYGILLEIQRNSPTGVRNALRRGAPVDVNTLGYPLTVAMQNLPRMRTHGTRSIRIPKLLILHGADVNAVETRDCRGNTLLHQEIFHRRLGRSDALRFIKFLLDHGADPHIKNNENQTAYELAKSYGMEKICEFMEASQNRGLRLAKIDPEAKPSESASHT